MESRLVRRATDRRVPLPTMPGVPIEPPPFYEFPFYTRQLPPLRRASKNATLGVPPDEMKPRKKSNVSPYRDLDDLRVALPLTANKCADFHEAPVHKNAQKHSSRETKKRGRGGGANSFTTLPLNRKERGLCVCRCVRVCVCACMYVYCCCSDFCDGPTHAGFFLHCQAKAQDEGAKVSCAACAGFPRGACSHGRRFDTS
jgi:hypothetical protein